MTSEPESVVLELLRNMRAEIGDIRSNMATKGDLKELRAELKSDMHSLRADVASDIHTVNHRIDKLQDTVGNQIVGLRRAVVEYHTSVVGHGILISDLEARVRRVEQHLELPALDPH